MVDVYKERKMNINDNDKQEDVNSVHNTSETNVSEARWVTENSLTQIYICMTLERETDKEKNGKINFSIEVFYNYPYEYMKFKESASYIS